MRYERPTRAEKEIMTKKGLNVKNWGILARSDEKFKIIQLKTKTVRSVLK